MAKRRGRINRIDNNFIDRFITNQYAVDIETTGSSVDSSGILQIGIAAPGTESYEINVKQNKYQSSKFHARPGGLDEYFKQNNINPEVASSFQSTVQENRRKYQAVLEKEKAKIVAQNLINRQKNSAANLVIHNANFEVKHFNRFFEGNSPLSFSAEHKDLINQNAMARVKDQALLQAGRISVAQARANDAQRQLAVYSQMMKEARQGGAIIDTMELAKTANALAQQKGLVKQTGDIALGTNMELLAEIFLSQKEVHRGVEDAIQSRDVAPKLVRLVEKLKRPDFKSSMLNAQEKAWTQVFNKDHLKLKIDAQTKAIKQAIDNIEAGRMHKFHSGKMATGSLKQFLDYLGRTGEFAPSQVSQGIRLVDHGVAPSKIVTEAIKALPEDYAKTFSRLTGSTVSSAPTRASIIAPKIALGAVAGLAAIAVARRISGGDKDSHNTIEGLPHGYFGSQRSNNSDFGSGYRGSQAMVSQSNPVNYSDRNQAEESSSFNYPLIFGTAGLYAAYKGSHYLSSNTAVNSLSYLGPVPAGFKSWAEVLGREKATFGDLIFNATRRFEHTLGGLPKAFSVSSLMSPTVFRDTSFKIDLTLKESLSQEKYLSKLTGIDLLSSGVTEVEYKSGKLLISKGKDAGKEILSNARLYQNIHDPNLVKGSTQFSKGYTALFGQFSVGKNQPFLIGGADSRLKASFRELHAFGVETAHKYFRLMDDPGKAIRDLFPDVSPRFTNLIDKTTKYIPRMGVGGAQNMQGTLPQLFARHAKTALPVMLGIPALYSAASWAIKQIAPEESVAGKAGLTGILAETARVAHMTYANVSDMIGLTSLRKTAEEQAPGMTGFLPFAGMTMSFGFTGMALGALAGISEEAFSADKYGTMLKNKTASHTMPGLLSKVKGFDGKYTLASKYGRIGALIGATLAAPMLLSGLGSSKSAEELGQEYAGKEVAIKKGRWWEFGMTPFEGSHTMYYRPNWYNRIMHQPKAASLYGGDEPSAIGKFFRSLKDPYWEEKANYYDRPYPVASASGDHLGLFGTLYEKSIGQVLKPTAYMHTEMSAGEYSELSGQPGFSMGMPGNTGEIATAPGLETDIRQQMRTISEAAGLRGFTASSLKEAFTGSQYFFEDTPVLQSSSEMTSVRRDFYDMNFGGLMGFTEAYRRLIPSKPYTFEYVNELPNRMPSWLPGEDYFQNFKTGDAFTKVPEGEYRLPGAGYATRFTELEGVNPEDYPLIHRYKILADVAMYSREYKTAKRQLLKSGMNEYEQRIFDETEAQVEDRRQKRKFNYKEDYSGVFGNYTKTVASLAQLNPIEQLTPFSPAHKFLPTLDPLSQYEESIYGKSFKMWQRPVDDFIKPFLYSTGNLVGASGIPSDVQEARDIERYFDEIKYVKFKKLEEQASMSFNPAETARYARNMIRSTRLGTDPYSENFNEFVLPKREREFFDAFMKMSLQDQAKAISIAPEDVQDIYQGQFDLQLEKKIKSGELRLMDSDRDKALAAIDARRADARFRKRERQQEVMESPALPDENWEGWQASVDLEDVKLKYLMNEGKNFHYYNLWDDRARRIRNRQDVTAAAQGINPAAGLPSGDSLSRADVIRLANASGISNARVSYASAHQGMTVDVDYDSEIEENGLMRELGYII